MCWFWACRTCDDRDCYRAKAVNERIVREDDRTVLTDDRDSDVPDLAAKSLHR